MQHVVESHGAAMNWVATYQSHFYQQRKLLYTSPHPETIQPSTYSLRCDICLRRFFYILLIFFGFYIIQQNGPGEASIFLDWWYVMPYVTNICWKIYRSCISFSVQTCRQRIKHFACSFTRPQYRQSFKAKVGLISGVSLILLGVFNEIFSEFIAVFQNLFLFRHC